MTTPEPLVGNTYDKYGTKNPFARWLMRGFLSSVTQLARQTRPSRLLEVGCGEGHLVAHLTENLPNLTRVAACDLSLEKLATSLPSNIDFRRGSAYELPYPDRAFDLVVCCEVLEHLDEPARAMAELRRVTSRYLLVSTPREPLWRVLNLLRLAYLRELGNTPGHVGHFSARSLVQLLETGMDVREIALPVPWVVALTERRDA
ncbi:MAG: class I SAM-dependent methyltransferase [Polyangiaceae bacterium]